MEFLEAERLFRQLKEEHRRGIVTGDTFAAEIGRIQVFDAEGRRWMIEDFDLISSNDYYQEGTLSVGDWFRSLMGVEEAAWFNRKDLRPFFVMAWGLLKRMRSWSGKKIARKAS